MQTTLSSNEKKVIRRITQIQQASVLRLGQKGHPIFDQLMQAEAGDDKDERFQVMAEIGEHLLNAITTFDEIHKEPHKLFELDDVNLMIAGYITHKLISDAKFPKTKAKILRKLEIARETQRNLN